MATDDDNLPEFFKVYIRHYTFQQMMFPSEFSDYMGRNKSGMTELVGSSGKTWRVELVCKENDLYFADGWRDFVKDNLVRDGDFLFFKYVGGLRFRVVIYDETMCEKETGLDANVEIKQEKSETETATRPEVSGTLKHTAVTTRPSFEKPVSISVLVIPKSFLLENSLSYKSYEKMVLRTSRDSYWKVNIINNPRKISLCGGWPAFTRENCIKEGDICKFELLDRLEMMVYVVNGRIRQKKVNVDTSIYTSPKIEAEFSQPDDKFVSPFIVKGQKAEARTKTMSSYDKPSFVLVMKKYNVERPFLATIPTWFIQENSLHYERNEKIILQTEKDPDGMPVSIIHGRHDRHIFSGGWASFVHCNNIKIGDSCKFELVNRLEMKVHITRTL